MTFEDQEYLEAVYAALFELLKTATFAGGITLKSSTRAMLPPDKIPVADQPALVLLNGPLSAEQGKGGPFGVTKWTFTALACVYLRVETTTPEPETLPATLVNYVTWGIQNALGVTKPPYEKQRLGGLVEHCWIEGEVGLEIVDEQAQITVPVYMLAGPSG